MSSLRRNGVRYGSKQSLTAQVVHPCCLEYIAQMRVVAVLAMRNERPYLANCLSHLIENGIDFAVVDNGSTDGSMELLQHGRYAPYLAGYRYLPLREHAPGSRF
jgi:hypothetical protein